MAVLIGWSGERSKAVAQALRDWLPNVCQALEVWMSEHDIQVGARWEEELNTRLQKSAIGIFCLTPENLRAEWVLFEAGAVGGMVGRAGVIPYLYGLAPSDVGQPLGQFQCATADKTGTLKALHSINRDAATGLSEQQLERSFEKWWPELEESLRHIPERQDAPTAHRPERALLEEILQLVRRFSAMPSASTGFPAQYSRIPQAQVILPTLRLAPQAVLRRVGELPRMSADEIGQWVGQLVSLAAQDEAKGTADSEAGRLIEVAQRELAARWARAREV